MSKKIITFFVVFSFILSIASVVHAQDDFGLSKTAGRAGYTASQSNIYAIISLAVNILLSVLFIVFLGVMFYAGLRWMTARGNEELSGKAKNALTAGVIGLIVVLSSYAIANFVLNKLGASSGGTSEYCTKGGSGSPAESECKKYTTKTTCIGAKCGWSTPAPTP